MDAGPPNSSPYLRMVWQGRSGPLCVAVVIPMPTFIIPEFPSTSGHRCVCSAMAEPETVYIFACQADSGSPVQGEGERCPSPAHSLILDMPDVVLGADVSSRTRSVRDSNQRGSAISAQLQGKGLGQVATAAVFLIWGHTCPWPKWKPRYLTSKCPTAQLFGLAGLTANPNNCAVGHLEVRYLGFHLGFGQVATAAVLFICY